MARLSRPMPGPAGVSRLYRERIAVADLVVLDGILDEQLHRHRRQQHGVHALVDMDIEAEVLLIAHLHQVDVGFGKLHLLGEGHAAAVVALQGVAQYARKLLPSIPFTRKMTLSPALRLWRSFS